MENFSIDFVTCLLILANWKGETYDLILVIVERLIKMVYYEPVKVTIDTPGLVEVIIDVVVRHLDLSDSIVSNRLWLSFHLKVLIITILFLRDQEKAINGFLPADKWLD